MKSEWHETTVANIASRRRNALVGGPFGSNLVSSDYVEQGVPVIRGQNMASRWVSGDFAYVSHEKAQSLEANIARPGDIVFTQRGTLGQVALVPNEPFDSYVISQSQMKLTVDSENADALFFYYQFQSPRQQAHIRQNAIQVGVPHTNLGILRGTPVVVPPIREQRAIARVLGTLDDKIELNRRMMETLEAFARTLFKCWFIDFDPVRAKARGEPSDSIRYRLGLPPDLQALFPRRMIGSELGEIPEGWHATSLGENVHLFDSKRIPLSNREREKRRGPYPYYGAASVMDYVDEYLFDGVYVLMGEDGSVINPDGTPVLQYAWGKFWVNNHAHVLQAKAPISNEQLLLFLRQSNIAAFVTGAVQAKLNQANLRRIPFVRPPDAVSERFSGIVSPLFEKIRALEGERKTLCQIRDTLLPRLLSGEVRVPLGDAS